MADTTTIGTDGVFGTVTTRIVSLSTNGIWDEISGIVTGPTHRTRKVQTAKAAVDTELRQIASAPRQPGLNNEPADWQQYQKDDEDAM